MIIAICTAIDPTEPAAVDTNTSDKQNARIEHDRALQKVLLSLLSDHTELYKQFAENESFKRWLTEMTFSSTYAPPPAP